MQTALILMTILGCDDSVTQCHYIATATPRYTSVALCDAASPTILSRFGNVNYPSVIAVCQKPAGTEPLTTPGADEAHALPQPELAPEVPAGADQPGIAARAVALVGNALPTFQGVGTVMRKPVHFATSSYSWLIARIGD